MICYAVTKDALHIADPNKQGDRERKIEYTDGKFKPYFLGAKAYETIIYQANWTIVPFEKIAARWVEFKNKTIGNDRFPAYTIEYEDDWGLLQELKDGYMSPVNLLRMQATVGGGGKLYVWRDGVKLPFDAASKIELYPGNNLLGINVLGKVGDDWRYIDFKYFNIIYSPLNIDPSMLKGELNKQYTFTAMADFPPAGARYNWYIDGAKMPGNTSTSYIASFKTEGGHNVSVKLVDSTGEEIQEAKSDVTITAAPASTPALLRDCKYISFRLFQEAHCVHNFYQDDYYRSREMSNLESYHVVEKHIPVTWNGLNFSGKYKGKTDSAGNRERQTLFNDYILDCTINGSVSSDGKTIKQLKMTMIFTSASASFTETWEYEFTDIPFTAKVDKLQHRDPASRNLLMLYQVFDSNNPEAHGKFSATYQGKPERYVTLSDTSITKMTDGSGTCFNCMWYNNSSPITGPIKFGFTVTTASMNEL
jgi:hypothetical protein